jgi:hypothetical protein
MQAAQPRVGTDADPQTGGEPGFSFAAESVADLVHGLRLVPGTARAVLDQSGEPLGEDDGGAVVLITEEAVQPQLKPDGNTVSGQIGQRARMAALDAGVIRP